MSRATLSMISEGDGYVELQMGLTRTVDLTTIRRVTLLYTNSALNTQSRYTVRDSPGSLSYGPAPYFTTLVGTGTTGATTTQNITLYNTADPEGRGLAIVNMANGFQTSFALEIIGTSAGGQSTRIISDAINATPSGFPETPVIVSSMPLGDRAFKIVVNKPTDDGGRPIDKIYAYLSTPNTDSTSSSAYELRNTTVGLSFELLTVTFDYPTIFTNNTFELIFDGSCGLVDSQGRISAGIRPDTIYQLYIVFNNGTSLSQDSNVIAANPSARPDKPTNIVATGGDQTASINFQPPSNSFFSDITGLVVTDGSDVPIKYFKNTATGFVVVPNQTGITNNTTPAYMNPNLNYSFLITGLTNNVLNMFKIRLFNRFGGGVSSDPFPVISQSPPGPVRELKIVKTVANPVLPALATSNYPANIKNLINPSLLDVVPIDINFKDPSSNWPLIPLNSVQTFKTVTMVCDSSATALSVAIKRFYGQGGTSVSASGVDYSLTPDVVVGDLKNCIVKIDNPVTGINDWVDASSSTKTSFMNNIVGLTISIPQAILALDEYYKVLKFARYLVNDVSFNTINDATRTSSDELNYIYIVGLSNEQIFVPAGSFVRFSVQPEISLTGYTTINLSGPISYTSSLILTNNIGSTAPELTLTSSTNSVTALITQPIFTYGYSMPTNYVVSVTKNGSPVFNTISSSNNLNIPLASGVPGVGPDIFISDKTSVLNLRGFPITNGDSYQVSVSIIVTNPITNATTTLTRVTGPIIPTGQPSPLVFGTPTVGDASAGVIFTPLTNAQLDGTTFNQYKFYIVDSATLDPNLFATKTQSELTSIFTTAVLSAITLYTQNSSRVDFTGLTNGTTYYIVGRTTTNQGSFGDWSKTAAFIPTGAPTIPLNFGVTQNNDNITVTWDAPQDDGRRGNVGAYILHYTLYIRDPVSGLILSSTILSGPNTRLAVGNSDTVSKSSLNIVNGTSYLIYMKATSLSQLESVFNSTIVTLLAASSAVFPASSALVVPPITPIRNQLTVPIQLNGSTLSNIFIMIVAANPAHNQIVLFNAAQITGGSSGNTTLSITGDQHTFTFTTLGSNIVSSILAFTDSTNNFVYIRT